MTVPLVGGQPRPLGFKEKHPAAMADSFEVHLPSGAVRREPIPRTLMVVLDGTSIYWADARAGTVMKLTPTTDSAGTEGGAHP